MGRVPGVGHPGAADALLHAVAPDGALANQDSPLAAQCTQLPERLGWHMKRRAEPELTHAGQPPGSRKFQEQGEGAWRSR